jgi:hypothetical protein
VTLLPVDTIVVVSTSAVRTDYTPLFSGIVASMLVAAMAFFGTWTQRSIARAGIKTQLGIARRANVVQSRREWMTTLRSAVAAFEAEASALALLGETTKNDEDRRLHNKATAELIRLQTSVILLLNLKKPSHVAVYDALRGIWAHARYPATVEAERKQVGKDLEYPEAQKYETLGEALGALDWRDRGP